MRWIRTSLAIGVLALSSTGAERLAAQYTPGGGGGGGHGGPGGRRGGMHGGPPGGRMSLPSPEEVEGPPAPPAFRDIVTADDGQSARYGQMYQNHMAQTREQRDGLRAALAQMRSASEARDRDAARGYMSTVRSLGDEVQKSDDSFDKAVNGLLRKDQQKRYKDWKKERKRQWDERRKEAGRT